MKKLSLLGLSALALGTATVATATSAQAQTIRIDGSSTVFPLTEAVAEEFGKRNRNIRVTVGVSGTGGGFKKFATGETDISNASRPIKNEEAALARQNNINFIELPIAYDALTVVVNPRNTWATNMTTAELKKIWEPGSTVRTWSQVRAGWPNQQIRLYAPGTDSGTFDYFSEAINGKSGQHRRDYTASEDDTVLVQGVARDVNALAYFGLAYYEENRNRLKAVSINGVAPTPATVVNGTYQPLSRPMFIYVSTRSMNKPEVAAFVRYYMQSAPTLARQVGYVGLPADITRLASQRFNSRRTGSMFTGGAQVGVRLADLLRRASR